MQSTGMFLDDFPVLRYQWKIFFKLLKYEKKFAIMFCFQGLIMDILMEKGSVIVTRAVLMGRYGMLKCRANFSSSYTNKNCPKCNVIDDESHRINYCSVFRSTNLYDSTEKIDYDKLFSNDLNEVLTVVTIILKLWDLGCGKNSMRNNVELHCTKYLIVAVTFSSFLKLMIFLCKLRICT